MWPVPQLPLTSQTECRRPEPDACAGQLGDLKGFLNLILHTPPFKNRRWEFSTEGNVPGGDPRALNYIIWSEGVTLQERVVVSFVPSLPAFCHRHSLLSSSANPLEALFKHVFNFCQVTGTYSVGLGAVQEKMHEEYDSRITGRNRLSWAVVISLGGIPRAYPIHCFGAFKLFKLDSRGSIHIMQYYQPCTRLCLTGLPSYRKRLPLFLPELQPGRSCSLQCWWQPP